MFRTRNFLEIASNLISSMRSTQSQITDFNVGSVNRSLLEAPAAEIDQLYTEMANGLIEGIPTAIYRSFDFDLLPPQRANGVLRFIIGGGGTSEVRIPLGFIAATPGGIKFQTAEEVIVPPGQGTADVLAVALEPGPLSNVSAGSITKRVGAGNNIASVTNPEAFANGRDQETTSERKLRFIEFVRTLAHGTVESLVYIAKTASILDPRTGAAVERVLRAKVEETVGHVRLHIYNGAGNTTNALVTRTQQLIDGFDDPDTGLPVPGYRPAGMKTVVIAMAEIPVPVVMSVEVALKNRSADLMTKIVQALSETVRATPSGGRLKPLDLINAALSIGVVLGATIEGPLTTLDCPLGSVMVPGAVTVTWR